MTRDNDRQKGCGAFCECNMASESEDSHCIVQYRDPRLFPDFTSCKLHFYENDHPHADETEAYFQTYPAEYDPRIFPRVPYTLN